MRRGRNSDSVSGSILDDPRVPMHVDVIDVEQMVVRVIRMERESQEATFAVEHDLVRDVQKRPDGSMAADDPDQSSLLDDVERRRIVRR